MWRAIVKANVLERFGGAENFVYRDVEAPRPGAGEVLVRVAAAGVSFADTLIRGGNLMPLPMPAILGMEGAGAIEALGEGVNDLRIGQRVAFALFAAGRYDGAYATHVAAVRETVFPLPDAVSFDDAAALGMNGIVALNLVRHAPVTGRSVLVHSAAGGIGTLLVQLLRHFGAAQVIAVASSAQKAELAEALGAHLAINSSVAAWPTAVREATGGNGVDVIYDAVGGETSSAGLDVLAAGGTLVIYGAAGGTPPVFGPAAMGQFALKGQTIAGYSMLPQLANPQTRHGLLQQDFSALFSLVESGALKPTIGTRLPLPQAADAHRLIESRKSTGKVLLVP